MQNLCVNLQQTHAACVVQALYVIFLFRHLSVEETEDILSVIFE